MQALYVATRPLNEEWNSRSLSESENATELRDYIFYSQTRESHWRATLELHTPPACWAFLLMDLLPTDDRRSPYWWSWAFSLQMSLLPTDGPPPYWWTFSLLIDLLPTDRPSPYWWNSSLLIGLLPTDRPSPYRWAFSLQINLLPTDGPPPYR